MARINTVGLTELANQLKSDASNSKERIKKMMEIGAEKVADAVKNEAENQKLRKTGKLIQSIKPGPVELYSDSASVEIWPQGTRKNGRKRERNAVVGFVQHYGRSYKHKARAGTFFFDKGTEAAEDVVINEMAEIWHDGE